MNRPLAISDAEREVLRAVVESRCRDLLLQVSEGAELGLPLDQRNRIRSALTNEFCEVGLKENSEPNEHGLLLEKLIDYLGPRRDEDE